MRPVNTQKKWPCEYPFGRGFHKAGRWAEYFIPYLPKLWTEICFSSSQDYENSTPILNLAKSRAGNPQRRPASGSSQGRPAVKRSSRPVHNEHRSPWPDPALLQRLAESWAFCVGSIFNQSVSARLMPSGWRLKESFQSPQNKKARCCKHLAFRFSVVNHILTDFGVSSTAVQNPFNREGFCYPTWFSVKDNMETKFGQTCCQIKCSPTLTFHEPHAGCLACV